jgi:ABC-type lipoprotein export system ATPase subunit/bifunctional DNA-binding transcriptional regulator/antitoxin component of YhaV-PrlF toxin-antitoxin module
VKIHKIADLEVVALQGLDLEVKQGELLGIVGASGSGKSTLLNILGGLDRPSAGRVTVGGRDLLKMSNTALTTYRRTQVGFVWQQGARNVIPYLSAQANVELPMILAGRAGGAARKHAVELLDAVGLADRRGHYLGQLSGGEQQRVAIAVALANSPSLLLADEPTGELDSNTALTIYKAFRDLRDRFGVTTLIVSHDVKIARHVDRVVAIRDGKLAGETVRRAPTAQQIAERIAQGTEQQVHDEHFVEYAVLDSAGRLQIPKEMREQYGIKERAHLEPSELGILIKAVVREEEAAAIAADQVTGTAPAAERKGIRARISRLINKPKNPAA